MHEASVVRERRRATPIRPSSVRASARLLLGHALCRVIDDGLSVGGAFFDRAVCARVTSGRTGHVTARLLIAARPRRKLAVDAQAGLQLGLATAAIGRV